MTSFKDCALAFRFSAIDRLPEAPSAPATKGTLVHRALELLFSQHEPGSRTVAAAIRCLSDAWRELAESPELSRLELTEDEGDEMRADAEAM
ncbi:MAG TPA: PD-(D/E)XK nuclease family protein, partial [Acidimicrobiales bacterium]|nr:PD-(D/E)XK nuclease family protein [Acidimicrobiales bacterium]